VPHLEAASPVEAAPLQSPLHGVATGLRESKKQGTRAALIESALLFAAERGYHGFTIADLAERVGVSRRTFSNYFAGKAECLAAASDRWMDAALAIVDRAPADAPNPELLRMVLAHLAREIADSRAAFLSMIDSEPELVAAMGALDLVRVELVARVITERTGMPNDDVRVNLLAEFCLAAGKAGTWRWIRSGREGGRAALARDLDLAFSLIDFSPFAENS